MIPRTSLGEPRSLCIKPCHIDHLPITKASRKSLALVYEHPRSAFDSYDTVLRRWPIIITNIIDHVHRLIHDMTMESKRLAESGEDASLERAKALDVKVEEGKGIISKASRLKYRMARDQELE